MSALFILVIALVSLFSAFYGMGYLSTAAGKKHPGSSWCFYNLLFAAMLLIVSARNGVLFLMAWEGMSLASFFLVMSDHEKPKVQEAGWIYLAAAHLGVACLMILFLLMGGAAGNLDFDHLSLAASVSTGALFLLALIGFGAKLGFLPLHVWLPEAYPAAPSHASAVMGGAMINTGIYGLLRILSLLGPPQAWWGWALIIIGAASGIFGILSATAQRDLKRMLAYSSVENMGIIAMGLGIFLLGTRAGVLQVAALGLFGALLHMLNHSLFKSLLFMGAGVVQQAAQTLAPDRLGGMQKGMPKTALAFLTGAVAISGLPPLNGFVGEFLIYMGAFSAVVGAGALGAAGMISLLALALIGGLATVCFTQAYGMTFSGEPRTPEAAQAREPGRLLWGPMAGLAACCLLLGLAAPLGLFLVAPAAALFLGEGGVDHLIASVSPLLEVIGIAGGAVLGIALLLALLRSRLQSKREITREGTWDCGYIAPTPRIQYTASSFSRPVVDMFRWLARPLVKVRMGEGYFPKSAALSSEVKDIFREYGFAPLFRGVARLAEALHGLQQGRNQIYVLYIAIAVLALLLLKVR